MLQVVEGNLASCQQQLAQVDCAKRHLESELTDLKQQMDKVEQGAGEVQQQHLARVAQLHIDKRTMESDLADVRRKLDERNQRADEVEEQHLAKVDALREEVATLQAALQNNNDRNQVICCGVYAPFYCWWQDAFTHLNAIEEEVAILQAAVQTSNERNR